MYPLSTVTHIYAPLITRLPVTRMHIQVYIYLLGCRGCTVLWRLMLSAIGLRILISLKMKILSYRARCEASVRSLIFHSFSLGKADVKIDKWLKDLWHMTMTFK